MPSPVLVVMMSLLAMDVMLDVSTVGLDTLSLQGSMVTSSPALVVVVSMQGWSRLIMSLHTPM